MITEREKAILLEMVRELRKEASAIEAFFLQKRRDLEEKAEIIEKFLGGLSK